MVAAKAHRCRKSTRAATGDRGVPRITTSRATPKAPPTWRAVWFTALPTAKRSMCRLDTAAALRTGKVSPMPRPVIRVAGSQRATYDGWSPIDGGVPGQAAGEDRRTRRAARRGTRSVWATRPAGPDTAATTRGPGVTARPARRIE